MIKTNKTQEEVDEGKKRLERRLSTIEMLLKQRDSDIPAFVKDFKL